MSERLLYCEACALEWGQDQPETPTAAPRSAHSWQHAWPAWPLDVFSPGSELAFYGFRAVLVPDETNA